MLKLLGLDTWARYVVRLVYRYIAVVLFGLVALFFIFDLQGELVDVGKATYTLKIAALFAALQIPSRIYETMPIATMTGAIIALASLANHSEISVLRAASLRPRTLLRVLLVAGLPLVCITLLMGEFAQPKAELRANAIKLKALGFGVGTELKTGVWLRDTIDQGGVHYININAIDAAGVAQQLRRYTFDTQMRLIEVLDAQQGVYTTRDVPALAARDTTLASTVSPASQIKDIQTKDTQTTETQIKKVQTKDVQTSAWVFKTATLQAYSSATGARSAAQSLTDWRWESTLNAATVVAMQRNPERLDMVSLIGSVSYQLKNGLDVRKSLTTLLRRVAHPLVLWVMLILALPYAYVRARGGAVAVHIFMGVVLGVAFYAGSRLFEFLTVVQNWPAWVSAPAPIGFGLALSLFLFWRYHRLH